MDRPEENGHPAADALTPIPEEVGPRVTESPEGVDILLVEDELTTARTLEGVLRSPGRRIWRAASAREARAHLGERWVDVAVLDLILPDGDGRDLIRDIRSDPTTSGVAIVVHSGLTSAKVEAECMALGADAFVLKQGGLDRVATAVARQIVRIRGGPWPVGDDPMTLVSRRRLIGRFEEVRRGGEGPAQAVALIAVQSADPEGAEPGDAPLGGFLALLSKALPPGFVASHWGEGRFVAAGGGEGVGPLRKALEELALRAQRGMATERGGGGTLRMAASTVLSDPGEGLPGAVALAADLLERGAGPGTHQPSAGGPAPAHAAPRVLLVEDDDVTARLVEHRLSRDGFKVTRFADGREAYDALDAVDFDVALLDVKLPGMDGMQLLSALRERPGGESRPVLILSAMTTEAHIVQALELGADDYILKPFSPLELVARVKRHLRVRSGRSG